MNSASIRFNEKQCPEFYRELRKRVNTYFKDRKISKHANVNMVIKTLFMLALYTTPLVLMLTGVITSFWGCIAMWSIMGLGMSGIGLSIMHDANHNAYSRSNKVNHLLGSTLNYIGGFPINWKIQHNVLHHSFTNICGYDEDIEKQGIVRFSPTQMYRKGFRFQILYVPFLYAILTIYWVTFKDFSQAKNYHKRGLLEGQGISYGKAIFFIILHKIWYLIVTLVLPLIFIDLPWWQILIGFFLMHAISGVILALIFQAAHVINETEFFKADEGQVENSWAIHQMKTTSNFANGSKFFSWFIGGLNYQVEHHLFPHICHVHYRNISHIVRNTAKEYGVPYNEHKTFFGALRSHFTILHSLGKGKT